MNTRQLLWLGGSIIVLAILYVVVKSSSIPIAAETTLPQVDTARVTSMTIISHGDTIRIDRKTSGWQLTKPIAWPANDSYVKQAMKLIADMRIETEVTANPRRAGEYGVDSTGVLLTINTGAKSVSVVLGDMHPGSGNSYARLADDSTVYQVRGNLKPIFSRSADLWRDRSIVTLPADQIVRFAMAGLEIKRDQGGPWRLTFPIANDSINSPVLQRRFDSVARLSAMSFAPRDKVEKLDWTPAKDAFEIESVAGDVQKFRFLKKDDGHYYVKRNDEPTIFIVPKNSYERIFVNLRDEILGKKKEKAGKK